MLMFYSIFVRVLVYHLGAMEQLQISLVTVDHRCFTTWSSGRHTTAEQHGVFWVVLFDTTRSLWSQVNSESSLSLLFSPSFSLSFLLEL